LKEQNSIITKDLEEMSRATLNKSELWRWQPIKRNIVEAALKMTTSSLSSETALIVSSTIDTSTMTPKCYFFKSRIFILGLTLRSLAVVKDVKIEEGGVQEIWWVNIGFKPFIGT
jgi:hypothetical protein